MPILWYILRRRQWDMKAYKLSKKDFLFMGATRTHLRFGTSAAEILHDTRTGLGTASCSILQGTPEFNNCFEDPFETKYRSYADLVKAVAEALLVRM